MARVFRPEYTRALPAGAMTRTRDGRTEVELKLRGRKPAWYEVRRIKGRDRVVITAGEWYLEYPDPDNPGATLREKGFKDKTATEALLLKKLRDSERRRAGLTEPGDGDAGKPLSELLTDYLAVLAARGRSEGHRGNVSRHVTAALAGCRWHRWKAVTADSFTLWLGELRKAPKRERTRQAGSSNATLNSYVRDVKAFVRWAARNMRCPNPLDGVAGFNPEVGRRRSRYALTDPEFDRLCAAAEAGRRLRGMTGPDRAVLYRVAAYTGFRAAELAALPPERFDLDGGLPGVTIEAGEDKAGRGAVQPLPAWLVAKLRAWLAGKPAGKPVFPGGWDEKRYQRVWLRADLTAAGLPVDDPTGRPVTFHGLRRRYVSGLVESGADPKQLQTLARHSSPALTLQVYAEASRPKLAALVDKLPGGR